MQLVGVDVGGTFTDLVAVNEASGEVRVSKVPSTPTNQAEGVLAGLKGLCGGLGDVRRIVHGSTVATNTVLEGKGARVALVTTRGFRDTLEIGRCRRMVPGMFNTKFVRPRPVAPRRLRFEVTERLGSAGEVLVPMAEDELVAIAARLEREAIDAVAICFLHAYANPVHEERAKAILTDRLGDRYVCTSAEILAEYREFERFSTAALNAYVAPVMRRYIGSLARELAAEGYGADLYSMASNGGIMSSATTVRFPIRTILSGPAGGVSGAIFAGRAAGVGNLITYDMGGTSTDVCLLQDLRPLVSTEGVISGMPVKTPQIAIHTVGAGGGSIAWIDVDGALKVGPQSAGAVPGPACYAKGGTAATITDANVVLGRLSATSLLGGRVPLDPSRARGALEALGRTLGRTELEWLAEGVIELGVAKMAAAIRKISIERGYDPREFTLVAMGGAGPMHAVDVARELRIRQILVPRWPGNISALGLLTADLSHDFVRTYIARLGQVDLPYVEKALAEMTAEGLRVLSEEGVSADETRVARFADLRFVGQAYELTVPIPTALDLGALEATFREHYQRRYGHDQDETVELVALRVSCTGLARKPEIPELRPAAGARRQRRPVCFVGRWHDTQVVERDGLAAGEAIEGPAIVEEFGATTIVPPRWRVSMTTSGAMFVQPSAEDRPGAAEGEPHASR